MLGLGMDEFDEDEDARTMVQGIPIIADKGFLEKYGTEYVLSFNENREVVLAPR